MAKSTKPKKIKSDRGATRANRSFEKPEADEPIEIGRPHGEPSDGVKPGTERARDEQRSDGGPRYGGGPWKVADERGDRRFGKARNDDADLSEVAPGQAPIDDDDAPSADDPELAAAEAAGEIEGSGQRAGMGRGEKPRRSKDREP